VYGTTHREEREGKEKWKERERSPIRYELYVGSQMGNKA
jgi:hypothetical protein